MKRKGYLFLCLNIPFRWSRKYKASMEEMRLWCSGKSSWDMAFVKKLKEEVRFLQINIGEIISYILGRELVIY